MRHAGFDARNILLGKFDNDANRIWTGYLEDIRCGVLSGSFKDRADSIWATCLDDHHLCEFSLSEHVGVKNRFPVTQEFMVAAIVAEQRGEAPPHPARKYFVDALHASIERMVGMIVSKYAVNCSEPHSDLAQDCFLRIWNKLHKFDAKKAKFTTWIWRLCSNLLNRKYRRSQRLRQNELILPSEDMERKAVVSRHYDSILAGEFSNAVRELGSQHPKWKNFVYALLGEPDSGMTPGEICIPRAATIAGVGRGAATHFYRRHVQPFLRKEFAR